MKTLKTIFAVLAILAVCSSASANVKQLKIYREVYPDIKPGCVYCHVDAKPKKGDGKHDLNAYGEKLKEMMADEELTADMVKEAGSHEDFEAEQEAAEETTE